MGPLNRPQWLRMCLSKRDVARRVPSCPYAGPDKKQRRCQPAGDPAFQAMDGSILDCIQGHYTQFLDDREVEARTSALDDLKSRTHFVTLGDSNSALQEAVRCDVNAHVRAV